jgi:hypothetical protein
LGIDCRRAHRKPWSLDSQRAGAHLGASGIPCEARILRNGVEMRTNSLPIVLR